MAAGADSVCLITVHGETANDHFTYTFFCLGGMGARASKDGLSTTGFPSGVAGTSAEVTETLAPVLVHRRELTANSGGAGEYRGGLGQTIDIGVRTGRRYGLAATADRTRFPAEGVAGRPYQCVDPHGVVLGHGVQQVEELAVAVCEEGRQGFAEGFGAVADRIFVSRSM